jgi:hypothetical protein
MVIIICVGTHADEPFRQALMSAREQQAEVWAEEVKTLSDDELHTHEEIGRARLRKQSRQRLAGKFNPQFADNPTQIGVNVGVAVVVPEAERQKLIERRDCLKKVGAIPRRANETANLKIVGLPVVIATVIIIRVGTHKSCAMGAA